MTADGEAAHGLAQRIGLYGSYFLGMAGVGFTLRTDGFLKDRGFSDLGVGLLVTFAHRGLVYSGRPLVRPRGMAEPSLSSCWPSWPRQRSCCTGRANGLVELPGIAIRRKRGLPGDVESLAGAEATHWPRPANWDGPGDAAHLEAGRHRAYGSGRQRPGRMVRRRFDTHSPRGRADFGGRLRFLLDESVASAKENPAERAADIGANAGAPATEGKGLRDSVLWTFVAAMVLFHISNAPGGVYLSRSFSN